MNNGEWRGLFVDRDLDDYCLTATEFRIACRIGRLSRRSALCRQSIKSMSLDLRLTRTTIRKALKVLIECRLVYQVKPGAYRVNPPAAWVPDAEVEGIRKRILGERKAAKQRSGFRLIEAG